MCPSKAALLLLLACGSNESKSNDAGNAINDACKEWKYVKLPKEVYPSQWVSYCVRW